MEITLVDILQEIKNLRIEMNQRFKEQEERLDKKMDQKFKEQEERLDKKMDQRFKEQEERIEARFKEQDKKTDQKFEEQDKIIIQTKQMLMQHIKEQIDTSTKEIAEELRGIVAYFEKKERKQLKKNKQFEEEMENNKVSHKAYDARLYKIELSQSNLETRVLELNNN